MPVTFDKMLGKLLMHKHKSSDIIPIVPAATGVVANGLVAAIPSGHMLEKVVIKETGGAGITINLGYTAGSDEIGKGEVIVASDRTILLYDHMNTALTGFNVYISKVGGGAWAPTSLDIYFVTRKVK